MIAAGEMGRRDLRLGALPPRKLLRLVDVIRFNAQRLHSLLSMVASMEAALRSEERRQGKTITMTFDSPGDRAMSGNIGEDLVNGLEELGLSNSIPVARRLKKYFEKNPHTPSDRMPYVAELMGDVRKSIYDSLELHHLIAIEPKHYGLYEPEKPLFGQSVDAAFPSSAQEVADAGKCLALGLPTACVFHLMRALEPALLSLANELGVQPKDNWNKLLNDIENAVRDRGMKEKRPNWTDEQPFFAQACASFFAIKNGWRNHTAHLRLRFSDDEANHVFEVTKGLMGHLAKRLREPKSSGE